MSFSVLIFLPLVYSSKVPYPYQPPLPIQCIFSVETPFPCQDIELTSTLISLDVYTILLCLDMCV